MAKLLTIEDDSALRALVADWLTRERHDVESVSTGKDALHYLKTFEYDLVILDLGLPDMTGFEILATLRQSNSDVPVLILTGIHSIDDKERGLELGADDYLTKPFNFRELVARVKALLRRPRTTLPNILQCADLMFNTATHEVTKDGKSLPLTPKEYSLLEFFMRHPNQVFSTQALLERVWRSDSEATEEAIVACIGRLRKKIDQGAGNQSLIGTVYGAGYVFKLDKASTERA